MKEAIERYWTSYFYSGSLALIVSWVLLMTVSGCRIGSHIDNGPTQDIGISGYYSTRPVSYSVTTAQTTGTTHNLNLNVADIPTLVANYFTDPTSLVLIDDRTGTYAIFPPSTSAPKSYQIITVAANLKSFGDSQETGWEAAWNDSSCAINSTYTVLGNITSLGSGDPTVVTNSIGKLPISGRLSFKASYETQFRGDCSASWRSMRDCYQTLSSCPGSTPAQQLQYQDLAKSTYDFWVGIGAMASNDIGTTSDMRFDVSYQ